MLRSDFYVWDTNNINTTEPLDRLKNEGWKFSETPKSSNVNSILRMYGKQIEDLAESDIGSIHQWDMDIGSIPTGFVLCDGSNNTPDMRNKFIVSALDDLHIGGFGTYPVQSNAEVYQPTTYRLCYIQKV